MSDKFIGYFRVVEACERSGCPVCRCLEEDSRRQLAALLYEHVTDPQTRHRLRESWGLCNWHTWMLPGVDSSATGASILYEALLQVCSDRVERLRDRGASPLVRLLCWLSGVAGKAPRRVLPRLVQRYRERARCPLCTHLRVSEADYVTTVIECVDDAEFERAYEASTGLCLPHLIHAVERSAGATGLPKILQRTLHKWENIRRDLERFVAKNEYRNREPITGAEAEARRQAFEVLAGKPGLFGSDLHRGSAGARHAETPAARLLEVLRLENHRLRDELAAARREPPLRVDRKGLPS